VVPGVGRVEAALAGHGERDGNTHCYTWQRVP
jgi:isopropylmalate/homocitrate/citramalate synthase